MREDTAKNLTRIYEIVRETDTGAYRSDGQIRSEYLTGADGLAFKVLGHGRGIRIDTSFGPKETPPSKLYDGFRTAYIGSTCGLDKIILVGVKLEDNTRSYTNIKMNSEDIDTLRSGEQLTREDKNMFDKLVYLLKMQLARKAGRLHDADFAGCP